MHVTPWINERFSMVTPTNSAITCIMYCETSLHAKMLCATVLECCTPAMLLLLVQLLAAEPELASYPGSLGSAPKEPGCKAKSEQLCSLLLQ